MPSDPGVVSLLSEHPALVRWLAFLALGVYALKLLSQMSETVAGLLGKVGQRWRRQGQSTTRAAKRRVDTNAKIQDLENTVLHFESRVADLEKRERAARIREDLKSDFITYDQDWHFRNERHGAALGWQWPEPHHMTFDEYVAQRETGHS